MSAKWKTVEDEDVRMVWNCEDSECLHKGKEIVVDPTFYQDNGTPLCECGQDMIYVRTEILV